MIIKSGKWPCVVCGKGGQTNKFIYKWYNGLSGDLSQVADSFRCRRCERIIQEADLVEDPMVDV